MKRIYSYDDHKEYLKDFYQEQKKVSAGYSYARFSEQAELNSPNYLKLIIDGTRNLTVANIHQFAKPLNFDFNELAYFESLVLKNQAETREEKVFYSQRLKDLKRLRPKNALKTRAKSFVSQWYMPALMVYAEGKPIAFDSALAARKIGVSENEVQAGLKLLSESGILKEEGGLWTSDSVHVLYQDRNQANVHQRNYLLSQLELSRQAFKKKYSSGAKFRAHTFSIPETDFAYYDSQISSFIESMVERADADSHDNIVQLNVQFFPLGE